MITVTVEPTVGLTVDSNVFTVTVGGDVTFTGDVIGGDGVPDGGTTGQVLAKASDVDGDVEWADAAAGAVPTSRQVIAGTGLTGGGDLSADRTFAVAYGTTAGTAAQGNDSRLSDSRTPTGGAGGFLSGTYPNPGINDEAFQDAVGAMVTGNTESGGTLTYDDTNGKVDLTVDFSSLSQRFTYNSAGAQSGNRYNDWADLMAAVAASNGHTIIDFEQSETIPVGTYDLTGVGFEGTGKDWFLGGETITIQAGTTLTWPYVSVLSGLALVCEADGPIELGNDDVLTVLLEDGGTLASAAGCPFVKLTGAGATVGLLVRHEGRVFNGEAAEFDPGTGSPSLGAGPIIEDAGTGVNTIAINQATERTYLPPADLVTGANTSSVLVFLNGSTSSFREQTPTNAGFAGTNLGVINYSTSARVKYVPGEPTDWSGISDDGSGRVEGALDELAARTTTAEGALSGKQDADADLAAIAALAPSNDDVIQRKAGAWTNRTMAQVKTDLALVKGDVGLGNVDNTSDANKPVSTATQTALDGKLATTGGGKDTVSDLGSMSGTVTVDLANGNSFHGTLSGDVTSWTLSNATSGKECEAIIEITQHASSAKTVAYPSAWKWAGGTDHVMSTATGAVDIIVIRTRDGGTTIHAAVMGKAFA